MMRRFANGLVGIGIAVACSTLTAGCFGDLKGVKVNNDLGSSGDDGGGGGGSDGGGGGGGGDMKAVDKTCALPHVQVMVVDGRSTSGIQHLHQVLRIPLDGRPPCAPLQRGGSLPDGYAIGFFPPSTTLYGETDGRVRFLDQDDTEAAAPYNPGDTYSPTHLFVVNDDSGAARIAVAYDGSNEPQLPRPYRIDVLDKVDWSTRTERWLIGTDTNDLVRTNGLIALDTDPRDRTRVFALRNDSIKDPTEVFTPPWAGSAVIPDVYVDSLANDLVPRLMRTLRLGTTAYVAWVYTGTQFEPAPDQIVLRTEESGKAPKQWGPITCTNNTGCSMPYQFSDVVPDFDEPGSVLATCYVEESLVTHAATSNLIRMRENGECETLYRGDLLPESNYLMALAAAVQ